MDAISLFKRLSLYMHEDALCFAGVNQAGSDIGVTNSRLSMSSVGKSRDGLILHGAIQTLSCSDMVKSEVRRTSRHAQHRKNTAMQSHLSLQKLRGRRCLCHNLRRCRQLAAMQGSRRRRKQKKFSTLLSRFCSPPRLPSFERFSVKFLKEALSLFSLRSFDFFTLNPIFRSQPLACVTLYDTGTPRGRRSPRSNKSRGAVEVRPPWCRWRPDQAERTPRLRRGVCT